MAEHFETGAPDFIGFILDTDQPAWRKGYKKIDIARGKQRGIYDFNFYLDDFCAGGPE